MYTTEEAKGLCILLIGGDLYTLKELLGYSQINTTLIYSHLTKSHLEGEANKVRF